MGHGDIWRIDRGDDGLPDEGQMVSATPIRLKCGGIVNRRVPGRDGADVEENGLAVGRGIAGGIGRGVLLAVEGLKRPKAFGEVNKRAAAAAVGRRFQFNADFPGIGRDRQNSGPGSTAEGESKKDGSKANGIAQRNILLS